MPKNNNLHVKFILMQKCRAIKLAFNKFKEVVGKAKIFNTNDEALLRLTLDNLLNEIRTATRIIKEKNR